MIILIKIFIEVFLEPYPKVSNKRLIAGKTKNLKIKIDEAAYNFQR